MTSLEIKTSLKTYWPPKEFKHFSYSDTLMEVDNLIQIYWYWIQFYYPFELPTNFKQYKFF